MYGIEIMWDKYITWDYMGYFQRGHLGEYAYPNFNPIHGLIVIL